MPHPLPLLPGRGTNLNPPNRFEAMHVELDGDQFEADRQAGDIAAPLTRYFVDTSRQIIASNDSPDVGFTHSVNPYRGCSHGCVYCYARPGHEYLGLSAGLDFETKIMVKPQAAELLRTELASPRWVPTPLGFSGVTDAYQPVEAKLQLTRRCLEVLVGFNNPALIITKNALVTRDVDLLKRLAEVNAARVYVSITTLDPRLTRVMEPRTSTPARRLAAVAALSKAGIPVGVLMAPVVPGLTEHEIPALVQAAADAGARVVGYVPLRLPLGVADLFSDWLERHFPDRKLKVLNRVRSLRGGRLNDPRFGHRMRGEGIWAEQLQTMFALARRRAGLVDQRMPELSVAAFRAPALPQLTLW